MSTAGNTAPRPRGDGPLVWLSDPSAPHCSPRLRGMDPTCSNRPRGRRPASRSRGDGPDLPTCLRDCSPPARGWSPRRRGPLREGLLLPAPARMAPYGAGSQKVADICSPCTWGMVRDRWHSWAVRTLAPRVRGDSSCRGTTSALLLVRGDGSPVDVLAGCSPHPPGMVPPRRRRPTTSWSGPRPWGCLSLSRLGRCSVSVGEGVGVLSVSVIVAWKWAGVR